MEIGPLNPDIPLVGKRAVVTGAGRGIGRATALALAAAGAEVAATARTQSDLSTLALDIEQMGRTCLTVQCDVTDPESVRAMSEACLAALGGIDILVNNAGRGESHPFAGHPDELWHRMIALNLNSVYYVTRAFAPSLLLTGGRIINVASTAGLTGGKYVAAYTAAKHGVVGLTRALAVELGPKGVTVNAVCPGFVDTPMTREAVANIVRRTGMSDEEARERLAGSNPQKRLIAPEEVAGMIVYLASDAARGINGQALVIDGGAMVSGT